MASIRKEIHESCANFVRETGLTPTRIYIGSRKWDELSLEFERAFPIFCAAQTTDRPRFDGLDIYLAADPDHLHVTR